MLVFCGIFILSSSEIPVASQAETNQGRVKNGRDHRIKSPSGETQDQTRNGAFGTRREKPGHGEKQRAKGVEKQRGLVPDHLRDAARV